MSGAVLVAGIGNVFLGDDGFGVETVRQLAGCALPDGVEAVDFGVRGVHLAYQLLDGYDTAVLVDATARGGAPGTLYVIDAGTPAPDPVGPGGAAPLDGHQMTPDTVLALLDTLCAGTGGTPPRQVLVVGCEPAATEEGMGLSAPVAAAVPEAVRLLLELVRDLAAEDPDGRSRAVLPQR
ncbi:hydrogenase maturation protease [Streptomyces sp. WAC06614]|uniref:hydrogenase maturation protease n=1 Tax=Streptomyces sp. WAC06614 TaxID=2487416 RepID=UPI000F793F5A|nr:hydrogenase maturation protease [Streptomyces sp. WAC06614]RSS81922.1 hydrogenase maturation protease [Streptomyces sp. WAC06614]